jgi:signal transduction histidine kinase
VRTASASLGTRLLAGAALWILLALVAAGILLTGLFRAHVEAEEARRAGDHLDELIAGLRDDGAGGVRLDREPSYPLFHRPYSGLYWTVLTGQGKVLLRSRSLWDELLVLPARLPDDGEVHRLSASGPEEQALVAWGRTVQLGVGEGTFSVVVAADRAAIDAAVGRFTFTLVTSLAILGTGLFAAAGAQVAIGLHPLRRLRRALATVRSGRAETVEGRFPAEVQPLVEDLNTLLADKTAMLARARTQAGNLAHALKTPLSILANEADALAAKGSTPVAERLNREVERMRRQVEVHLARARAAATQHSPGEATPVLCTAETLAHTLARLYAHRSLAITSGGDPVVCFRGERQDLQEMLGNLMDNACKWTASRVQVTVLAGGSEGRLIVHVDDDGPGLPASRRAEVLARGVRLDELVEGSGLGLAIVQELAELYGGGLELGSSPLAGLRATVTLPAVHPRG